MIYSITDHDDDISLRTTPQVFLKEEITYLVVRHQTSWFSDSTIGNGWCDKHWKIFQAVLELFLWCSSVVMVIKELTTQYDPEQAMIPFPWDMSIIV